MNYLILQNPGHNRVYYNLAAKLALAELKLAVDSLSSKCDDIKIVEIENIRYLSFEVDNQLSEDDLLILSHLSFVFAIYILEKNADKVLLVPVKKGEYQYLDDKISSLLRYPGKTNELFTRMMINVALLSSNFSYSDNIKLLDPVSGKGTTLFEGAVFGYDVYGIDIEPKSIHDATVFFKKYLEKERLKHTFIKRQILGKSKSEAISINEFVFAGSKEDFKAQENLKTLGLVCGNSHDACKYFKKEMFNIIVGDLPYGIYHGNTTDKRKPSITRNPTELLNDCLPEWLMVLKTGGVVVVAWNSFVVSRFKLSKTFVKNGFEVLSSPIYDEFEHMVDKSIKRDILVAKKL
jgi:SAM-dependent methyltransferase